MNNIVLPVETKLVGEEKKGECGPRAEQAAKYSPADEFKLTLI